MRSIGYLLIAFALLATSCGGSAGTPGDTGGVQAASWEGELAALPLPPGVDPVLWRKLKDEFRAVVMELGSARTPALAPESDLSAVNDLAVAANPDGTATLAWSYRSQGDYNQDRLVSINDITPVGVHYLKSEDSPDWEAAQLADGNNDGHVTIHDITPIGQNYQRRVEGYQVYAGGTPGEQGDWQELAQVAFESGATVEGMSRLRFSHGVDEPLDGSFYRVAPYDGEHSGIPSNAAQFSSVEPLVSVLVPDAMKGGEEALWEVEWTRGTPPFTISWEFGGGAADIGPVEAASPDQQAVVMLNDSHTESASYSYAVTVVDSYGLTGAAQGDYTVEPDPHPVVSLAVPEGMRGSQEAVWTAEWYGGSAPYTIAWEFGGGAADVGPLAATSPDVQAAMMINDSRTVAATYAYTVAVLDDLGYAGIAQGEYEVGPDPHPLVTVEVPTAMSGGEDAGWSAQWIGGTPPYTITWDFGGGAANVDPQAATSPDQQIATMINFHITDDAAYSYLVSVVDDEGMEGTAAGDYLVVHGPNYEPVIDSADFHYKTRTLAVEVSDPNDGETLTVTVTEPPGLHADATGKVASATGPLTTSFVWYADEPTAGGSGTTTVTVEDALGATASTDVEITIPPLGALYAIPQVPTAAVDEPVTILVTTDVPGYPFQYACMVSVTAEPGAELVDGSFNVGAIGGDSDEPDGIWAAMDPQSGFFIGPLYMAYQGDNGDGRERWEFSIIPMEGSELLTESGDLFNFQFSFATPGTYTLGFEAGSGYVMRTYYGDGDEYEYQWGDISNDHDGIPNSIVVE